GQPKAAPMRMIISEKLVDDGLLWVGDAAGLTHPITGQGIPQAIESGLLAAEIASTALQKGDTRQHILRAYDSEIRTRFSI
ncbi:MAG: NAD(P)/FAD-dependent oxidoreductase, partial [Anaerolineales bacterium]